MGVGSPLIEVNAIDGVKTCFRTMAKCQKETRVTRMGEPFLHRRVNNPVFETEVQDGSPNSIPKHLDRVVELLVLKLALTDLHNPLLEAALPSHELQPSSTNCPPIDFKLHGTHLEHPNTTQNLVHQRHPLVPRLHQVLLRAHDDLARKVVQREEQARHRQPEEALHAEQAVEEQRADDDLDRRVDDGEQVPREHRDTVDVGRHERHHLRLG